MQYVWMFIVGLVVGLVARAVLPGTQSLGWIMTGLLGIAGSVLAGLVGQGMGWYASGDAAGFVASVVGAVVLLFVVGKLKGTSAGGT